MWKGVARLLNSRRQRSHNDRRRTHDHDEDDERNFTIPSIQINDATSTVVVRSMPNLYQSEASIVNNTIDERTMGGKSLPLLYSLTTRWAWPAVSFRVDTHPHEASASICDEAGDTVLHWACFGNPPMEPVMALLSACPELATTQNNKGFLPVHVACSYRASSDVIRTLVAAYPEGTGVATFEGGSTPLHLMCDYGCSVDALRAILECSAGRESVLVEDKTFHRKPLYILLARRNLAQFNRSIADLRSMLRQRQHDRVQTSSNAATLQQIAIPEQQQPLGALAQPHASNIPDAVPHWLCEFWQKAALLVLAEHYVFRSTSSPASSTSDAKAIIPPLDLYDDSRALHACLKIPRCPPSLIEFALLLHPEQMLTPDDEGRLPLHIAASKLCQDPSAKSILIDLVTACPQAAQHRDGHNLIPLELCGASAWNESLARLVLAYPLGLAAMDFDDALYPRIWARISLRRDTLDALYQMIREQPPIFARCGRGGRA